ncbi:hypothetical protein M0802_004944 [Mischocyttarus mexicanus]|nr:hypothetical protein M0802_004944 [Mischocyttarus mexicanus]
MMVGHCRKVTTHKERERETCSCVSSNCNSSCSSSTLVVVEEEVEKNEIEVGNGGRGFGDREYAFREARDVVITKSLKSGSCRMARGRRGEDSLSLSYESVQRTPLWFSTHTSVNHDNSGQASNSSQATGDREDNYLDLRDKVKPPPPPPPPPPPSPSPPVLV